MKMKCINCGEDISTKSLFCANCGIATGKQRRKRRTILINAAVTVFAIALTVFLWKNYLLRWQLPLFRDKMAAVSYVNREHPGSKIIEQDIGYKIVGYYFPSGIETYCDITFEKDGFQYMVSADDGKVYLDFYPAAKLSNDVRQFICENFFNPRGIKNIDVYCDFSFHEYDGTLPEEWSEYDDSYTVDLFVCGQGTTPYDVDWIYDFYKFWEDHTIFAPEWYLCFWIYDADRTECYGYLNASHKYNYKSASEMYENFH